MCFTKQISTSALTCGRYDIGLLILNTNIYRQYCVQGDVHSNMALIRLDLFVGGQTMKFNSLLTLHRNVMLHGCWRLIGVSRLEKTNHTK